MELWLQIFFAVLLVAVLIYLFGWYLVKPVRWLATLLYRAAGGFILVWLGGIAGGLVGLTIPLNLVTVLLVGLLGVPGLVLLVVLNLIL